MQPETTSLLVECPTRSWTHARPRQSSGAPWGQLEVVLEEGARPSLNLLPDLFLDADELVLGLLPPHVVKVVCESLILFLLVIFPFVYQTITTVYHCHEKPGKTATATSSNWWVNVATAAHTRTQLYYKIKAKVVFNFAQSWFADRS